MKQRRAVLPGASVATAMVALTLVMATSAATIQSSSAAATAMGAAASASTVRGAPLSSPSSVDLYYEEVCPPPKSCSTKIDDGRSSPCSYSALRGISSTRRSMQPAARKSASDQGGSIEMELGIKMQLSNVKSEEAAVGCALLAHHGNRQGLNDDDPDLMITTKFVEGVLQRFAAREGNDEMNGDGGDICPQPNTCQFGSAGAKSIKSCDDAHLNQLKRTRDALDASYRATKFGPDEVVERMASQSELEEQRAEAAVVGCVLMMQREVVGVTDRKATMDKSNNVVSPKTSSPGKDVGIILQRSLDKYRDDEERFKAFLFRNHKHFTATSEMKSLVQEWERAYDRRAKIEMVLAAAGHGGVPDIVWQERLSRERAVERLKGEGDVARGRLLETLQRRSSDGELTMADLDMKEEEERVVDRRTFWDRIAEELGDGDEDPHDAQEEDRSRREVLLEKARRNEVKDARDRINRAKNRMLTDKEQRASKGPHPAPSASSSRKECNTDDNRECNADDQNAIEGMRKDIELLRTKAMGAKSEQEREARLGWVREMENRLEMMMKGLQ